MRRHFSYVLVLLVLILPYRALAMEDTWDPELYRNSSQMQKRWAEVVLRLIDIDTESIRNILDVGSGDGDITFTIANKYALAKVIGLDISPKMVKYANEIWHHQSNLLFVVGDAQNMPFHNQFGLVTSFNTLHRLENPQLAIKEIYSALKPQGIFVAAFPVSGSPIMSEAIESVDSKPEWQGYFSKPDRKTYQLSDTLCKSWLKEAGFIVLKSRTKWETEVFESKEKFRDLLRATFSQRAQLPAELEMKFFEEIVEAYIKKAPLDENNQVHFFFNRVEIVAIKAAPQAKL